VVRGPRRFALGVLPTPVHRAVRLERALGAGPLLLKRDDLIGFAVAGNKTRPLEHLLGAALAEGADVLVTGGGPGSNFVPAAALAARAAGLDCELVVWGDPTGAPNLALATAAGATLIPTGGTDRAAVDLLVERRAEELRRRGRKPYPVPRGGSTPLGAVGFALAAAELAGQLRDRATLVSELAVPDRPASALPVSEPLQSERLLSEPLPSGPLPSGPQLTEPLLTGPPLVVIAVGSGGSYAGLLAGFAAAGLPVRVLGVSVSRPPAKITERVRALAAGCAELIGGPTALPPEIVDASGPGFGTATERERELARLALHTEGLLLDETYGAKAFAVAVDRLLAGDGPVVLWHTGGVLPAIAGITKENPS
jgi:D-cysteine desulfhydrase